MTGITLRRGMSGKQRQRLKNDTASQRMPRIDGQKLGAGKIFFPIDFQSLSLPPSGFELLTCGIETTNFC